MHLKPNSHKHKKALIAGSAALLAVILILVAILVSSCSNEGKFEALYAEGSEAYAAGDFKTAAEKLEKALEHGESVDCYVLLANTYYAGLNDLNRAIDILYAGSVKFDDDTIDSYLESLKAIKAGDPKLPDAITIGTETISPDVTSLVLKRCSGRRGAAQKEALEAAADGRLLRSAAGCSCDCDSLWHGHSSRQAWRGNPV